MTIAERFLKDGTATEELISTMENELPLSYIDVAQFWNKTIKPTLTEDERVILRNIDKKFKYISRQYDDLRISYKPVGEEGELFYEYNHLFQFIKERRGIFNTRIIRR